MQRRWNNGEVSNGNGNSSGEFSELNAAVASDRQTPTPSPFVPSGSTPVKSLTGRFDKENLLADFESCADVTALRQLVAEQMREIETLKSQVRTEGSGSLIKPPLDVMGTRVISPRFQLNIYVYPPFQLANRDGRIRQLEEAIKKMELGSQVNGSTSTKH